MASKINPKGVFKSNLKSKSPNPKGINPKGVYKAPAKPRVNPKGINPAGTGPNKGGINPGGINPGGIKKPVTQSSTPRTRAGVSKGNTPGTAAKYAKKTPITQTQSTRTRAGVSKGNAPGKSAGMRSKKMSLAELESAASKRYKPLGPDNLSKTSKTVTEGASKLLKNTANKAKASGMDLPKSGRKNVTAPKAIYKPDFKSFKKVGKRAIIATAAALLAKGVYDKVSEKNKATALTKTKDDTAKKAKDDAAKKAKDDAAKNQAAKSQALKNELAKREAAKKDRVKEYSGVKDKWGRSASDKWFGFDPKTKTFTTVDYPKKVKTRNAMKLDNPKPITPKPAPVAETSKVDNTTQSTKTTGNGSSSTAVKDATSSNGTSSSTSVANPSTVAITSEPSKVSEIKSETKTAEVKKPEATQVTAKRTPKGGLINKIRGAVNESRERRVGRALGRGDKERAAELEDKIKRTESKMYMKKGGVVKKTKPKKK